MEHIYIGRVNDAEVIFEHKRQLELKSLKDLVELYNKLAKIGIVGLNQQALYLIALRKEFLERLGESPIFVIDKVILGMVGKVKLLNGQIEIFRQHPINCVSSRNRVENFQPCFFVLLLNFYTE